MPWLCEVLKVAGVAWWLCRPRPFLGLREGEGEVSAQHQLEHARERLTAGRDQRLELLADARIKGNGDDGAVSFGCGGHGERV